MIYASKNVLAVNHPDRLSRILRTKGPGANSFPGQPAFVCRRSGRVELDSHFYYALAKLLKPSIVDTLRLMALGKQPTGENNKMPRKLN
jgi:hypothetical protein